MSSLGAGQEANSTSGPRTTVVHAGRDCFEPGPAPDKVHSWCICVGLMHKRVEIEISQVLHLSHFYHFLSDLYSLVLRSGVLNQELQNCTQNIVCV